MSRPSEEAKLRFQVAGAEYDMVAAAREHGHKSQQVKEVYYRAVECYQNLLAEMAAGASVEHDKAKKRAAPGGGGEV